MATGRYRKHDLYLGRTTGEFRRGVFLPFKYREYHLHVLGQFGLGKSKFLEHLIREDLASGQGLCLIDPHGSLYDAVVRWCARQKLFRRRKIYLFDPTSGDWTFAFNPLSFAGFSADEVAAAVGTMVKACAQAWGGEDLAKTPRLLRILRVVFHALAEQGLTLYESLYFLDPGMLRTYLVSRVSDSVMQSEWQYLLDLPDAEYVTQVESARNRLGEFLHSPVMRATIGQTDTILDFHRIMDDGGVVLMNLNLADPMAARVLGSLLVSDIYTRARRRKPDTSRPFYLYIDECSQFFNDDIERIITQLRKFGLRLTLSHQNLGQLRSQGGEAVFAAVMQIPNRVCFGGLPPDDAEYLARSMFLGEVDYEEPKRVLDKPAVVDYVLQSLRSRSRTVGSSSTRASGRGLGTGVSVSIDPSGNLVAEVASDTEFTSDVTSEGDFDSETEGESESYVPILETLPTTVYNLEEQLHRHMDTLVSQPGRHAMVKLFDAPTCQILTPYVSEARVAEWYVDKIGEDAVTATPFALAREKAEAGLGARREELLRKAREYTGRVEPEDFFE